MMNKAANMAYQQASDDELWDIYDINRRLTGETHRRGEPLKPGNFHLVVHVCIFNSKNQLLIQKRQPWKKGYPNMWDLTVGGSAIAGDDSQKAAERETMEEIGLAVDLANTRPHFTINFDDGFDDYYLITKDVDLAELTLQSEEVQAVKWVNRDELLQMKHRGEMIPYYFLDKLFDIKNKYGMEINEQKDNEIKYAELDNLASWMNLVEIVRWIFPGLETEELLAEYKNTVIKNINRKSALCATDGNMVVGILLFSRKHNMLSCMAVHPEYRRRQIAAKMVSEMLKNLDRSKDIVVYTFREDDPKGEAPRAFYKSLGFEEGELIINMNYPEQRFILKPVNNLISI
jgi:isopentenyldiphosphate isomerase/GNAT superfamily N-acetyltransferase